MEDRHNEELRRLASENTPEPRRPLSDYIISQADLLKKHIPPTEYLLGTWLPMQSFGMVYAPTGVGKSWFVMSMALAIAQGNERVLGWRLNKQVPVLYVDGEMTLAEIKDRFQKLSPGGMDNVYVLPSEGLFKDGCPLSLDKPEDQEAFEELLRFVGDQGQRPQLIILDNLSSLRNSVNENDNSEMQKFVTWLVSLRSKGYAVLLVHHTGKNGEQRGASILTVPMDYTIRLSEGDSSVLAREGEVKFELMLKKMRARKPRPSSFTVFVGPDSDGIYGLSFDATEFNIEPSYRLLKHLALEGRSTYREMAKAISAAHTSIPNYLDKLIAEEMLKGTRANPTVSVDGINLLSEFWPAQFTATQQEKFVQDDDSPF